MGKGGAAHKQICLHAGASKPSERFTRILEVQGACSPAAVGTGQECGAGKGWRRTRLRHADGDSGAVLTELMQVEVETEAAESAGRQDRKKKG